MVIVCHSNAFLSPSSQNSPLFCNCFLDAINFQGFATNWIWEIVQNCQSHKSRPEKGVITKGVFSLEESLESLKSLNSLESLGNGRILLYFPDSGDSLKSLESLNSLESPED